MWQKINNDPVCFKAKHDKPGVFNMTKTGFVKAIKLVRKSGSIKCNPTDNATYWSCSNVQFYTEDSFMTIITNATKQALLPSEENLKAFSKWSHPCNEKKHFFALGGVSQKTSELVLGNLSSPLRLLKAQELQIWYGQDWKDCGENDNSGATCVDIFAWYL